MADEARNGTSSSPTNNYQDADASKESKLKAIWDQRMEPVKLATFYKNVVVLLLSWDQDGDDLHTKQEVTALAEVFEKAFHYKTIRRELKHNYGPGRTSQSQINLYLSNFVYDYDGDDTLLIVYYAGHGIPGEKAGGLKLAAKRSFEAEDSKELHYIIWESAEHNIKGTRGDVLVIFDCCHAGELEKSIRGFTHRAFEYLAATSANSTTRKPGPNSFTAALIWALKNLVASNKRFSTQDLVTKILTAPDFPREQAPRLSERGPGCLRKIVLAPLSQDEGAEQISPEPSEELEGRTREDLSLRFIFNKKLNAEIISSLATELRRFVGAGEEFNPSAILWEGTSTPGSSSTSDISNAQFYALMWKRHWQRRRDARLSSPVEEHPQQQPTPPAGQRHPPHPINGFDNFMEEGAQGEEAPMLPRANHRGVGNMENMKNMEKDDVSLPWFLRPICICFPCLRSRRTLR